MIATGKTARLALAWAIDQLCSPVRADIVEGTQCSILAARDDQRCSQHLELAQAGGGALYDLGSYALSACNIVFQSAPTRVMATLDRCPTFGIDRLTSAVLDYGDRHALFTVGTQSGTAAWGTHQQLSVLGETGWMRFEFPFAHARPTACALEWGDAGTVGAFASQRLTFEPANQYVNQVERFSRLLLGEAVPSWPIEDSLDIVRTTEALIESARTGNWQSL